MENNNKTLEYEVNRHSCYYLKFHLVVVTKYRKPIFDNEDIKARLIEIANKIIVTDWGLKIDSINTDSDHVHILFSSTPQTQLSKLVNNFKTVTSRLIRKEFADYLSKYYWKPYFWSDSYFIGTVSEVTEDIVKKYIANQGEK